MSRGREIFIAVALFASVLISECVIGGKEAPAHSRPYMASLQLNGKHECGGFLISEQWVMTAAHCISQPEEGHRVILGAHSLKDSEVTKQEFRIAEVYGHLDFNAENYDNDIALLKLDQPAVTGDSVKALEFQRDAAAELGAGEVVSTAGWGSTNNLSSRPDKLQELDIEVMVRALCGRNDYYGEKFTSNMMCASGKRKDTCDGDSGGPLLSKGVAVGVTSNGGKKCGTSRKPGLYTIISRFAQWINDTMQQ